MAGHSSPCTILSDRGPNIHTSIVKEVCHLSNTSPTHTTAYHPQTDGLVERFNSTFTEGLSMHVSIYQKDWNEHLPLNLFAHHVSPSATTKESPLYLLYGWESSLPIDASLLVPSTYLSSSVCELHSRVIKNLGGGGGG